MKPLHGISKERLGARVGRSKVWALGSERIRVADKRYTFGDENVYVSGTKRIRLGQVPNLPPSATELSCFILEE